MNTESGEVESWQLALAEGILSLILSVLTAHCSNKEKADFSFIADFKISTNQAFLAVSPGTEQPEYSTLGNPLIKKQCF